MPFIMQQQLHMPPASIWQRFYIMLQAILSSQLQLIFIPPCTFSTLYMHRGTIIMLAVLGIVPAVIPGMPMLVPGMPIPVRSIIIVLVIILTS